MVAERLFHLSRCLPFKVLFVRCKPGISLVAEYSGEMVMLLMLVLLLLSSLLLLLLVHLPIHFAEDVSGISPRVT